MALTVQQKAIYLLVFNATMIMRSVGKTLRLKPEQRAFRQQVFQVVAQLANKMDRGELREPDILNAILTLAAESRVSVGQAQKPINVLLKYHYYLTGRKDADTRMVLHCPIDSVILKELGVIDRSLARMTKGRYLELQDLILERSSCGAHAPCRVDFDAAWDRQSLDRAGLLE